MAYPTYPPTRRQASPGYARMMTALQQPPAAPLPAAPAGPTPQQVMQQRFAAEHPFAPAGTEPMMPGQIDPALVNGPRLLVGRRAAPVATNPFVGFRGPADVPGVFESVPRDPALNGDPVAGVVGPTGDGGYDSRPAPAAMASRYTLTQTTPIGQPAAAPGGDANLSALAMLTGGDAYQGAGAGGPGGGGGPGAVLSPGEQAALGLDQTRKSFATADALKMMQRSGAVLRGDEAPEIRANKLGYYEKLLNRNAGGAPSSQLAASGYQKLMTSNQPRLVTLGKDSKGRPVEGTVDRQGNFSRIKEDDGEESTTEINKLIRERDAWRAQGREDVAKDYDRIIKNKGSNSLIESLIAMNPGMATLFNREAANGAVPGIDEQPTDSAPKKITTQEEFDALPEGAKFIFNGKPGIKKTAGKK